MIRSLLLGPGSHLRRDWPFFIGRTLTFLLLGAFGGWLMWSAVMSWTPASYWFEPREVIVADAVEGDDPKVVVMRTIRRPFHAEWTVTVRKLNGTGLLTHCVGEGANDYSPDAKLPPSLTLSRWGALKGCHLDPGQYRVDTLWRLSPEGFPAKEVRVRSNLFRVTAR